MREFPLEIEPRLKLGLIRVFNWKSTEAMPVYEEILRLDERNAEAHQMISYCYAFEGDLPHAMASP